MFTEDKFGLPSYTTVSVVEYNNSLQHFCEVEMPYSRVVSNIFTHIELIAIIRLWLSYKLLTIDHNIILFHNSRKLQLKDVNLYSKREHFSHSFTS